MAINEEIADIFFSMADILEAQGIDWKPRAFRAAARSLLNEKDVRLIYKQGGLDALKEIPGVGDALGKKIIEYIQKGKISEYEKLKKGIPAGVLTIMSIPGIGPKKAYKLFKSLKIKSIDDLKKAIEQHKVAKIPGFGMVSEQKITESLGFQKKSAGRVPIQRVLPIASKIISQLKKLKEVEQIEVAGSLRRKEDTIGDIDLLVISKKPEKVMEVFTKLSEVKKVIVKGKTKSAVILKTGMNCDLRVVERESFGAALQYFTGNKQHNIEVRKIAIKKGYKLNEYGLFDKAGEKIAGMDEEGIYKKLGLRYIPPEKRKNQGELESYKE